MRSDRSEWGVADLEILRKKSEKTHLCDVQQQNNEGGGSSVLEGT
jgi:hypothetical protein